MDTNTTTAADALRALLALPHERPGSWEAVHVEALEDELQAVLDLLETQPTDGSVSGGSLWDTSTA